jgi:predicted PurR-regulated permease PerM
MAFQPRDSLHRSELELFAKKIAIVMGVAIAVTIGWFARDVFVLIFIAAVLSAGIAPAVHRVRVWVRLLFHRNIPRGTAVMIVYLPFLVIAIALMVFMVPRLVADTRQLSAQLPALLEKNVFTPLERYVPMEGVREFVRGGVALPRASVLLYVRSAATAVASFIAVLFMIGYMLVDAERLRNMILLVYSPDVRAERRAAMTRMARRMSSWLSAQLTLAVIIGVATFVGLVSLRVPYALPLAIFATFGEMVPVIGPIVGTAPALAIAILQSRWQFWSVLAMALLLQKLENLFIAPRIMSRKVEISPLAVFVAFMVGGSLLGIVGAIMAVPAAVILQVVFEEVFVARRERRQDVSRSGTLTRRRRLTVNR